MKRNNGRFAVVNQPRNGDDGMASRRPMGLDGRSMVTQGRKLLFCSGVGSIFHFGHYRDDFLSSGPDRFRNSHADQRKTTHR